MPLTHAPGHAQVDFGEALGVIGGVQRKLHYFAMVVPQSDAFFIKAYPVETAEAFCDGHVSAVAFFGGVPLSVLYDNTTIAVAKILGGGTRKRTRVFPSCSRTTCSRIGSADRARATTRGRWRGWWALPGGTSWSRCPVSTAEQN